MFLHLQYSLKEFLNKVFKQSIYLEIVVWEKSLP